MMLAESPFATQIRSDIRGLRIVFITLFFASVGMLGDPTWIARNAGAVVGVTIMLLLGKALVVTLVSLSFRFPLRHAVAAGVALAQVGEFGVVIAGFAQGAGLVSEHVFRLLVSSTLVTLLATPLLIRAALPLGASIQRRLRPTRAEETTPGDEARDADSDDLVIIVGFGPSGQRAAEQTRNHEEAFCLVIDVKPNNVDLARSMGFSAVLGDATNLDFLIHHGASRARAIVVTLPDHRTSTRIVESVRTLNTDVAIIVRSRYHGFVAELEDAGATVAVDEEYLTGQQLTEAMSAVLVDRFDPKFPLAGGG